MHLISIIYYMILEYLLIFCLKITSFIKRTPPAHWKNGTKGDVIIVPGFAETWIYEEMIASHLNKLGYRIHVIHELDFNFVPIQQATDIVSDYIKKYELTDVILLAHSKGGIIAKRAMDSLPEDRIQLIITISVPYHGTFWGYGHFLRLYEMQPGSNLIKSTLEHTKNNNKIYNFYSKIDNNVIPNTSAVLDGAHNMMIDVIGHTRILTSPLILTALISAT